MASVYVNVTTSAPSRIAVDDCREPSAYDIMRRFSREGWEQYRRYVMRGSHVPGCQNYPVTFAAQLFERAVQVASDFNGTITPYVCSLAVCDLRRDEYAEVNG